MARLRAHILIEGTRPILFHKFSVDALSPQKSKSGEPGNDPKDWRRGISTTEDRQLYVESTYAFGCIRDGSKWVKSGRASLLSKVVSSLIVIDDRLFFDRYLPTEDLKQDDSQPVYLDVRAVRNPATKGRNIRYRVAAAPGWKTSFDIEWEDSTVAEEQMESVLHQAGSLVGLGDARSIGFGRFKLIEFKCTEV